MADSRKKTAAAAGAGAMAATLAGGLSASLAADDSQARRIRRKMKANTETKRAARKEKVQAGKNKLAKMQLRQLQNINSKDLNLSDKKIHKELIKRQKDIIKGTTPPTLAKTAAKIGLKSIPGVGAFLTAISSKPAGKGSALTGPGSKMRYGGKVKKKK